MIKYFSYFIIFISIIIGCSSAKEISKNADIWLDNNAGTVTMDISGKWYIEGWGIAIFKQNGNRISGILGDYTVKGSMNYKKLRLGIYSGTYLFYTAEFDMQEKDMLVGLFYSYMHHEGGRQIIMSRNRNIN